MDNVKTLEEIQEINVEKELPKTLEEYVIKEIESYKIMNANLAEALRIAQNLNFKQNEEIKNNKNKFIELISRLKEDLKPRITVSYSGEKYINIDTNKLWEDNPESYEYYKKLFNLKEEGEEKNE